MSRSCLPSAHFQVECGAELSGFVNNPYLHDVTILCGPATFFAHSDILRSRCTVLHDLLQSSGNVIEIDTDPDVVLHLLKFIYTSRFPDVAAAGLAAELLRMARVLSLQDLMINLLLRFQSLQHEDRDFDERGECEKANNCQEGEGNGFGDFQSMFARRSASAGPFLNSSRFDGKATINVGQYKFRRQSAVLLAARSSWFAERIDSPECLIDASSIPVHQVALALRFIKMDGAEDLGSFSAAFEALHWSWVLGVRSLHSWVEHVIVARYLDKHNVCQIWSSPACGEYLAEKCMAFLQENFLDCASSAGFLNLRHEMIKEALNAGRIEADAVSMMRVLRQWAETNTTRPDECDQLLLALLPPNTIFNMDNRLTVLGMPNRHPLSCIV